MGISNPFGSKSERKLGRKEKRLTKATAAYGMNRAKRDIEDFMDDSNRQRMINAERMAARGMSGGTHAAEESRLFEAGAGRTLSTLKENKRLAELGQDVTSYGYKVQKRLKPLKILDDVTGLAMTGIGLGIGMPGLGAAAGAGTAGLEQAMW